MINDPGLWIVAAIVISFVFSAINFAIQQHQPPDPQTVLRRCRASLRSVREDLESLPAGREVHTCEGDLSQAEHLLEEKAARE